MNKEKLIQNLKQIKTFAEECLNGVNAKNTRLSEKSSGISYRIDSKMTLPKHILALRDNGFFKKPKTVDDACVKIHSIYLCDPNRVAVALVRLKNRRQLRKTSKLVNGKQLDAYVW